MRRSILPYVLTSETATRLTRVLTERGTSTLRDLERRHRFWVHEVKAAEEVGLVRIETHKPRIGRPSRVAVLNSGGVNNYQAAKLPRRRDVPRGLTIREEIFMRHFMCKRGSGFFGGGKHNGSAADTYRKVYGIHRRVTAASARSAGARLMRQPHMRAAWALDRRLMGRGGRYKWPEDMHSAGSQWLSLFSHLRARFMDWPHEAAAIIREAKLFPDAMKALAALALFENDSKLQSLCLVANSPR